MTKLITMLLAIVMVFSIVSCNADDQNKTTGTTAIGQQNKNQEPENKDEAPEKIETDYSGVLDLYRKAVDVIPEYIRTNENTEVIDALEISEKDRALFDEIFYSALLFYPSSKDDPSGKLSFGYAMRDLNNDGADELVILTENYETLAILSYSEGEPVLLGAYQPRKTASINADGSIHVRGSSSGSEFVHIVYSVADGGKGLELVAEFGGDGLYGDGEAAMIKYYEVIDGEKVYISQQRYIELQEKYKTYLYDTPDNVIAEQSGLAFLPLYSENDVISEIYDKVLCCTASIVDNYYLTTRFDDYLDVLGNAQITGKAVLDMDGDGLYEAVISLTSDKQIEHIVLTYKNGNVYVEGFLFSNLYYLNTDGSFAYNDSNDVGLRYGEARLIFNDGYWNVHEIWEVFEAAGIYENGSPLNLYYIEGESVTEEELTKYLEENQKTRVEFEPLYILEG